MRRQSVTASLLLMGILSVAAASQNTRTHRDAIRFALMGDSMITQRLSPYTEPAFLSMVKVIRDADFAVTNFENGIPNGKGYPKAPPSGIYMQAPAYVAKELMWAGIKAVNLAQNHTSDWGVEGLIETHRVLEESGLAVAGFGMNLAEARAPAYVENAKGRIALIGVASTFDDYIRAGMQGRAIRGRPGINALRHETEYVVDAATMASLKELAATSKLPFRQRGNGAVMFNARLAVGNTPEERTTPNKEDLDGITAAVKEAKRQADWVVVTIHAHEGAYGSRDIPAQFLVTFARACIDAGADVFYAHGPHVTRGIEIYKGKPIFYSMGNFIFQNETVNLLPEEQYEAVGFDDNKHTPADFYDARSKNDTEGFPADPLYWQSVIALPQFEGGQLKDITLYPIDLGFKAPRTQRGRPLTADADLSKQIIERLSALSKPFGTEITFENGVGHIKPHRSSNE